MEFVAHRSGIGESTIWNYLAGKLPKKIPKLPALAEACGCHPSELLTRSSKAVYDLMVYEAEELLLDDEDFKERSLHVARVSRQILMWENFFQTGDSDDKHGDGTEVDASTAKLSKLVDESP